MALISGKECEDMLDASGNIAAMLAIASRAMETLLKDEAAFYLAGKTPSASWRRRHGVIARALADAARVSQACPDRECHARG